MNEQKQIWEEITAYLSKESDVCSDPSMILESTNIRDDLNFDSLQAATMLMDLEDKFGIIVETNFMNIKTVGDVFQLVLEAKYGKLVG